MRKPGKRQAATLAAILDRPSSLCLDDTIGRKWWLRGSSDVPAATADGLLAKGWIEVSQETTIGLTYFSITEAGRSALRTEREGE